MKNKTIEELLALLDEGVAQLLEGDEYRQYLKTMSRFPSYSMRNTLLLYKQCPQASLVAGFQTWERVFGRHVKKGEKGLRILAPYSYKVKTKDAAKEKIETRTGFRSISVFDISQTEGKPLPPPPQVRTLEGECDLFEPAIPLLEKLTGFQIERCALEHGVNGTCRYGEKCIRINETLNSRHAFKTLTHECAHALLHNFGACDRNRMDGKEQALIDRLLESPELRETESESVSFVVCMACGIDCSEYSFAYIAAWLSGKELLPASLARISNCAQKMLLALQPLLKETAPPALSAHRASSSPPGSQTKA